MQATLIVRRDGQPERVFKIEDTETLIGRAPTANLQLDDDSISREHAVILGEDGTFTVEDLQSTNGIRVNGKKLRSAELSDGDEIQIGKTTLCFVLPS